MASNKLVSAGKGGQMSNHFIRALSFACLSAQHFNSTGLRRYDSQKRDGKTHDRFSGVGIALIHQQNLKPQYKDFLSSKTLRLILKHLGEV